MSRTMLAIAAFALVSQAKLPSRAADVLPVQDKAIVWEKGRSKMSVHYPHTGNAAIDKALRDYALESSVNPNASVDPRHVQDYAQRGSDYSLRLGYTVTRNDEHIFNLSFEGDENMGGSHSLPIGRTFSFLLPTGKTLTLADMVAGERGMEKISLIARAKLLDYYKSIGEKLDEDRLLYINLNSRPDALGFSDFAPQAGALILKFEAYGLGGGWNDPDISISTSEIETVLRKDLSVPQPSFSCEQARTKIEKAICSDASLASADREVAYRYSYSIAVDRALKSSPQKGIELQRAWLAQRNKICASGNLACLRSSYATRLKDAFL